MQLTVIGLGPGPVGQLTGDALKALEGGDRLLLRTDRHGIAAHLKRRGRLFESLDRFYETSEDFDALVDNIAAYVLDAAQEGAVCYAVPGSGRRDRTVGRVLALAKERQLPVRVIPGLGEEALAVEAGFVGERGAVCALPANEALDSRIDPECDLIVSEIESGPLAGDLKCRLLEHYPDAHPCLFARRTPSGQLRLEEIPLVELDRQGDYDHTSTLLLPCVAFEKLERYDLDHFVAIMRRLTAPDGCPWDQAQTHESLAPYLVEEAYEVREAVLRDDLDSLYDELGDVLLQVVFHAVIAQAAGEFDLMDVTSAVSQKMIRRHPHIFAQGRADDAQQVEDNWEKIKMQEKGLDSQTQVLRDVPLSMPALMRAFKLQKKAAKAGVEIAALAGEENAARRALEEALASGSEADYGRLLFAVVALARKRCPVQPELALNQASDGFIAFFAALETEARRRGWPLETLTPERLGELAAACGYKSPKP